VPEVSIRTSARSSGWSMNLVDWRHLNSRHERIGSCPWKWCSAVESTETAGMSRASQLAIAGRLTAGSSRMGAMVSSVM
jgi:hypothetical protein